MTDQLPRPIPQDPVEQERLTARRKALEDAAKVADKIAQCSNSTGCARCCETTGEDIAEAIRAMIEGEG